MPAEFPIETISSPTLSPPTAGALTPSPYSFLFTGDDYLRVTASNAVAGVVIAIDYRVATPDNPVFASRHTFTPTADRLATFRDFTIGDGYLLNMTAYAISGSPKIGQTFVKVQVVRGQGNAAIVLGTILQDYVTASQDVAWPGSPLRSSIEGGGVVRSLNGTSPAAGSELAESVPAGARWQLLALASVLTTSAAVANRQPNVHYSNASGYIAFSPHSIVTAAGTGRNYNWAVGMTAGRDYSTGTQSEALPAPYVMLAGETFGTVTNGIQAGDVWTAPRLVLREWLEVA